MADQVKTKKLKIAIIVVLLAILAIKTFLIGYYRIPQNGMYPTLPAGSRLFVFRHAYSDPSKVKRGDVIVFARQENGQSYHYIWRVVGLPGEKVEAIGESLAINGRLVERKSVRESDGKRIFREQIGDASYEVAFNASPKDQPPDSSVTVPASEFFVMGDNRRCARQPILWSGFVCIDYWEEVVRERSNAFLCAWTGIREPEFCASISPNAEEHL